MLNKLYDYLRNLREQRDNLERFNFSTLRIDDMIEEVMAEIKELEEADS